MLCSTLLTPYAHFFIFFVNNDADVLRVTPVMPV